MAQTKEKPKIEAGTKTAEKPWEKLTPGEKLDRRFAAWLSAPGINFATPKAKAAYEERATNIIDALRLKKTPKRIPVLPTLGGFAEAHCGYTSYDVMHDVDKAIDVMNRCTIEFDIDTTVGADAQSAQVWEMLDFKTYIWPGHGLPVDADGIQFNEGEYMPVEEYDAFLDDPTDYYWRIYLPRIMGTLDPLKTLPYLPYAGQTASVPSSLSVFGRPEIEAALLKLIAAGKETIRRQQKLAPVTRKLTELGYPSLGGGNSKAPFDLLGDGFRGTRGIIMDMFQRPEKLMVAMDRLVPILIRMGVNSARMGSCPLVGFALHKGADGYMSDEHFKTFYWGPLRKVCMGLIQEGLIPRLGAQGGYNSRFEVIRDLPKGFALWAFGYATDMEEAKKKVGDVACIMGNVPATRLHTGTPEETAEFCRHLIDVAGKGGGYMFSTAGIDRNAKLENVKAMIKTAKEYGVYSRR
ncbi:MAG TPA: uroporphyrinogen decarboxylase family protein [Dehalococcoidales bacterium]|nr:uroporphyrinogen decarboxylase family protein [Dehalococcoidales bacterium]